jgi:peptide-methionine (R)-S-oxide reductase
MPRCPTLLGLLLLATACSAGDPGPAVGAGAEQPGGVSMATGQPLEKVVKSEEEWRRELTPEQFRVLRKEGTERAFTGAYWDTKEPGVYHCAGCGLALFDAATKYDSGTGWPSFWAPIDQAHVGTRSDRSLFMVRTEVHCSRCGGHLGHVFEDGPEPTGLRYCLNSAALAFEPAAGD